MQFRSTIGGGMITSRTSDEARDGRSVMAAMGTGATKLDRWHLDRDATLRLAADRGGIVVRVDRGTVLVTREGDPEDHVLEEGEAVLIAGKGLVVAWALTSAALRVERGAAHGADRPREREVA
jgi:hypothetical protein